VPALAWRVRRLLGPRHLPAAALALLAVAAGVSGCLEPKRVVVDPDALAALPRTWAEERGQRDSDGWLGPKSVETIYVYDDADAGPPFDAFLQVFSLRELDRRSASALQALAERIVDDAAADKGIQLSDARAAEGERTIESGVRTRYTVREGTVAGGDGLFSADSTVRILAEVGHDGRSKTSFVAVGMAQVKSQVACPLIGGPCQVDEDETTWHDIVADPSGRLGATGSNGLVFRLVTA